MFLLKDLARKGLSSMLLSEPMWSFDISKGGGEA